MNDLPKASLGGRKAPMDNADGWGGGGGQEEKVTTLQVLERGPQSRERGSPALCASFSPRKMGGSLGGMAEGCLVAQDWEGQFNSGAGLGSINLQASA